MAKKKKVVRKKSAVPAVDDQDILRAQMREAKKQKKKQKEAEAAAKAAEEAAEKAEAEAEEQKRLDTKRRKKAKKKKAEEDTLARQKKEIEEQKRALEDERRKLEIESERAALEAERRKLEEQRQALSEEPKKKGKGKTKGKKKKKGKDSSGGLPQIDPGDLDEILALAKKEEDDEFADMPPAKAVSSRGKKKGQTKAHKKKTGASPKAKKKKATPAPEKAEEVELIVEEEAQPERVKDWVDDIKGGADWNRVGVRYGVPIVLLVVFLVYFGKSFGYGMVQLPKMRAIATLNIDPQASKDIPANPPNIESTQTWLPIGPLRILVPKDGPIAVDWSRPHPKVEYVDEITLYFRGWTLKVGRYKKDAIIKHLDGVVDDGFVAQYVTQGNDGALVKEVMTTLPDHFEWFSGGSWVEGFKTKLNLKEGLFPEIKRGLVLVSYGPAQGYFFGRAGEAEPQRIELFDAGGTRFSYLFIPGGFHRNSSKLRYAQSSAKAYVAKATTAYKKHYDSYEGKEPEPYRELLRAAMYGAGLAIGGDLDLPDVNNIRSALLASRFSKLAGKEDIPASSAFDALRGGDTLPELRRVMLGVYAHSNKKLRDRGKKFFEVMMGGVNLAPGEPGWDTADRWVENQEEKEAIEKNKKSGGGSGSGK